MMTETTQTTDSCTPNKSLKHPIFEPPQNARRYFTIGEVSALCEVKPHVLRYWEQEFSQLRPSKRRGNRRYYQYKDILLVYHIKQLLYGDGFTISGARAKLSEASRTPPVRPSPLKLKIIIEELATVSHLLD